VLTRAQKEATVAELREKLARARSLFAADYRGLSVAQQSALRGRLREVGGAEYRVAKNSLLRRAFEGSAAAAIADCFEGPTAVAFSYGDPVRVAKVLVDYAKQNEKFALKGGVMDGKPLGPAEIATLATLPSLAELRARLAGLARAPAQKLAALLAAPGAQIARLVEARRGALASAGEGG
jgi:large subunit ribosomal protein L10